MKQKLFTLLTLLLCLCSTAWAQTKLSSSSFYQLYYAGEKSTAQLITAASFPSYISTTISSNSQNGKLSSVPSITTPHDFSALDTDTKYWRIKTGSANIKITNVASLKKVYFYGNGSGSTSRTITTTVEKVSGEGSAFTVATISGLPNNNSTIAEYSTADFTAQTGYDADTYYTYTFTFNGDIALWGIYVEYVSASTSYTVTYSNNGGTGTIANSTGTNITLSDGTGFTAPSNYTFAGWNTANDGSGTSYTAGQTGINKSLDLFATWTQSATVDANGGSANSTYTATLNATSIAIASAPTNAGTTLTGYFDAATGGNKIANADGTLVANTSCTDANSKWNNSSAAPALYAQWKVNTPEISCTNNVVTISVPTGSTVYYTDDGTTTPTSESTPYTEPFAITATKTIKAIAIQANCTNSEVATQECEFATPKYTISYNAGGGSGTMTATGNIEEGSSQAISANTFTRECYTFANWTANVDVTVGGATINAGDPIADEATIQNVTGDITLTAQWNIVYSSSADFNVYAYANLAYKAQSGTWTPLDDNNFAYSLYNNSNKNTSLDHSENAPYVGLKIKNSSDYIKFAVPAGKQVTVIFGYVKDEKPKLSIDGGAETDINITLASDNQIVYYAQENADRIFKIKPGNSNATVIKKIFIEDASTEKVTATVGANGYTTFASPYALDLTDANRPAGLKAYKATRDGANLTFEELHQTVPAGTGLLLLGETKGGNYDIPVVAGAGTAAVSNALIGITAVTAMKSTADDNYFFVMRKAADESSALSFAPLATTAVNVPAGKVVIEVPNSAFPTTGSARELTFSFDKGNATGINTLDNLTNSQFDNDAPMYNLAGQKVGKSYKGIVIVNGKKFMNK